MPAYIAKLEPATGRWTAWASREVNGCAAINRIRRWSGAAAKLSVTRYRFRSRWCRRPLRRCNFAPPSPWSRMLSSPGDRDQIDGIERLRNTNTCMHTPRSASRLLGRQRCPDTAIGTAGRLVSRIRIPHRVNGNGYYRSWKSDWYASR